MSSEDWAYDPPSAERCKYCRRKRPERCHCLLPGLTVPTSHQYQPADNNPAQYDWYQYQPADNNPAQYDWGGPGGTRRRIA